MEEMGGTCYGTVAATGLASAPDTAADSDAAALVDGDDATFTWS
jgi:hypothetical protein